MTTYLAKQLKKGKDPHMVGKAWGSECEPAVHKTSGARRQRQMNVGAHPAGFLLLFFSILYTYFILCVHMSIYTHIYLHTHWYRMPVDARGQLVGIGSLLPPSGSQD